MRDWVMLFGVVAFLWCRCPRLGAVSVEVVNYAVQYEDPFVSSGVVQGHLHIASLDEDAFVSFPTPGTDLAAYKPCCENSQDPDCFQPRPGAFCIDDTKTWNFSLPKDEGFEIKGETENAFQFYIQNSDNCTFVAIHVRPTRGISKAYLWIEEVGDYIHPETTTNAILFSCAEIYNLAISYIGSFSGVVELRVFSSLFTYDEPALVEIEFYKDKLPLSNFHSLASIDMYIDGTLVIPNTICTLDYQFPCLRDFPPNADPLYLYYSRGTNNNVIYDLYQPNTVSFVSIANDLYSPLHFQNFTIVLGNLFDINGTELELTATSHRGPLHCTYQAMRQKTNEFVAALDKMNSATPALNNEVRWRWLGTLSPTLSIHWLNCLDFVQQNLYRETQVAKPLDNDNGWCYHQYGTLEYSIDPCCNSTLEIYECCTATSINVTSAYFQPKQGYDLSRLCTATPTCTDSLLSTYSNVLNHPVTDTKFEKECPSLDIYNTLVNDLVTTLTLKCFSSKSQAWCTSDEECIAQFGEHYFCGIDTGGSASPFSVIYDTSCLLKCNTSLDCPLQQACIIRNGVQVCDVPVDGVYPFWQSPEHVDYMVSCLASNILSSDKYLQYNLFNNMNISVTSSREELSIALRSQFVKQGCYTSFGTSVEEEFCIGLKTCSWLWCPTYDTFCLNETLVVSNISYHYCFEPAYNPTEDHYCGLKSPNSTITADVGQYGNCLLDPYSFLINQDYEQYLVHCDQIGGHYDAMIGICWAGPFSDMEDCVNPRYCPQIYPLELQRHENIFRIASDFITGYYCPTTCILNNANQSYCVSAGGEWMTYTSYNNVTYQECHLPSLSKQDCDFFASQYPSVYFWPGSGYMPSIRNNATECSGFCHPDSTKTDKNSCESGFSCSNPLCKNCNQPECTKSGFCDLVPGCYIPSPDGNCELGKWTPLGCSITFLQAFFGITKTTCDYYGGFFYSVEDWMNTSEEECLNFVNVCYHPATSNITRTTITPKEIKPYISFHTNCTACGEVSQAGFNWNYGKWYHNEWYDPTWMRRDFVQYRNYTSVFDVDSFEKLFQKAVKDREISLLANAATCRQNEHLIKLNQLSCLCGEDKNSNSCDSLFTLNTNFENLGVVKACSFIRTTMVYPSFSSLLVPANFETPDYGCLDLALMKIDKTQFLPRAKISLLDLVPSPNKDANRFYLVKNNNRAIVGCIISDGIKVELEHDVETPITICMDLPKYPSPPSFKDDLQISYVALGLADLSFANIEIIGDYYPTGTLNSCMNITSTTVIFPIGLIDNFESLTYWETFDIGTRVMLVLNPVIYFTCLVFCAVTLVRQIVLIDSKSAITFPRIALCLLLLFLMDRLVFFILIATNSVSGAGAYIIVLFSQLPALYFFSIYTLFAYTWMEVISLSKKLHSSKTWKPVLFISNFALYLLILVLLLCYSLIPETSKIEDVCSQNYDQSQFTLHESLALAYLIIFLITSCIIFIGVLVIGINILFIVNKLHYRRKRSVFTTCGALLGSGIGLLGQIFFLFSEVMSWHWTPIAVLIYLLFIDIIPILLLSFIYFHIPKQKEHFLDKTTRKPTQLSQKSRSASTVF